MNSLPFDLSSQDAIHNFSPQYQQYIQQSKISPEDERLESLRDLQVQAQQQQYYHQVKGWMKGTPYG